MEANTHTQPQASPSYMMHPTAPACHMLSTATFMGIAFAGSQSGALQAQENREIW